MKHLKLFENFTDRESTKDDLYDLFIEITLKSLSDLIRLIVFCIDCTITFI